MLRRLILCQVRGHVVIILINLIRSAKHGEKTTANPWGGTNLEWQVPSPPPLENFDEIPTIDRATYKFED